MQIKTEKTEYVVALFILTPEFTVTGPNYHIQERAELVFDRLSDAIEAVLKIMVRLDSDTRPLVRELLHKDAVLFSVSEIITMRMTTISETPIASASLPIRKSI